jgi:hypothetical protein
VQTNVTIRAKSRRTHWSRYLEQMEYFRKAYMILVGKLEGKRPLGGIRFG